MNQEDMQIIGTLALEKDTKRKGVFINTKSAIQYVVKSMMSDYKSDKLFTGYMNSFENDQKFDDEYRSDEERVKTPIISLSILTNCLSIISKQMMANLKE